MLTYADVCNMKQDEAELWIVNLIRNARLDAKVSQYQHMCPHIPIYVSAYYYMCPHTTTYVSSCYYMCPHTSINVSSDGLGEAARHYVSSYYYMCYHTSTYVSS